MNSTSPASNPKMVSWKSETNLSVIQPFKDVTNTNNAVKESSKQRHNLIYSKTHLCLLAAETSEISKDQIDSLLKESSPKKVERVLLDRLHYMETLDMISSEEKRKRVARETIDKYAALAARTGLQQIKDRLEDLAFYYLNPEARAQILHKMNSYYSEEQDILTLILEELQETLVENGIQNFYAVGRVKSPFSVWQKMDRKNLKFEQIRDIFAFRVIVNSIPECYQTIQIFHKTYKVISGRFKDYIRLVKDENYKALHTSVIGPFQKSIEIQVRTEQMNELAKESWIKYWRQKTRSY